MNVLTVAMARDEEALIPYFVRYYMELGDVTLFDDNSTDDTASAARAEGATVLPVEGQQEEHMEHRIVRAKDHAWKPVRNNYDWVIAVDVDEFLYHKDGLADALYRCHEQGATVLQPIGYEMVSDAFPSGPAHITAQVRRGVPEALYSKQCCFDPRRITDINYGIGAHHANPEGTVRVVAYQGLKLLHYRFLGHEWIANRFANRRRWQAKYDTPEGWCTYSETPGQLRDIIAELDAKATEVI